MRGSVPTRNDASTASNPTVSAPGGALAGAAPPDLGQAPRRLGATHGRPRRRRRKETMNEDIGVITKCYTVTFERTSKHAAFRLGRDHQSGRRRSMDGCTREGRPARRRRILRRLSRQRRERARRDHRPRRERTEARRCVWGWSYAEWEIEDGDDGCRYTFLQNGLADRGEDADAGRPEPAGSHESSSTAWMKTTFDRRVATRDEQHPRGRTRRSPPTARGRCRDPRARGRPGPSR